MIGLISCFGEIVIEGVEEVDKEVVGIVLGIPFELNKKMYTGLRL